MKRMTKKEITEDLITNILALDPKYTKLADFTEYSRIRNLVISEATILDKLSDKIMESYNNSFITTANEDGLLRHLADNGLTWGQATKSIVIMRIGSKTKPKKTIEIPQLFEIATKDEIPVIFRTAESGSIDTDTIPDSKGYYTTEILAESIKTGRYTNVNVETITQILTQIDGINIAYNPDISSGGSDKENIERVRQRLLEDLSVYDRGTIAWFKRKARDFGFVKDVYVRQGDNGNGEVEVTIAGDSITQDDINEVQAMFDSESEDSAGAWNVVVGTIERNLIDIDCKIYTTSEIDFETINTRTQEYFAIKQMIGYDFVIHRYIAWLLKVKDIFDIELLTPNTNIVIPSNQVATLGSLNVTFEEVMEV